MFEDLYDAFTRIFSFSWPIANAEITDMFVENTGDHQEPSFRLGVCYRFYVGDDGPYCGIDYWRPTWTYRQVQRVKKARSNLRLKHTVPVRYRRDDPSQNRLDSDAWRGI